ncbi:MAG: tRNA epoxyqueuosine(34) reductase QueG [Bacteroidales bacterium]|nr:tRNA epoxyqueuosine(34) reductase QueG [Bacteroidales bacterium]
MPDSLSASIVAEAQRIGFDGCGISLPDFLETDSKHVEHWLAEGCQGTMSYLERNREKRYDPRLLVEGTKSIISVIYNYFPEEKLNGNSYHIAKYAYGADYHEVVKKRLKELLEFIETKTGKLEGTRLFVDSAPVLDRAWAARCGLGFIGKNTSLIHPKKGSFFFIGHIFLPIQIEPVGKLIPNHCGTCTKCLDTCPTGALDRPFHIDAKRCISYLTIEHKGSINDIDSANFKDWIYGCDLCQDACPYNRFSTANKEPLFQPSEQLKTMDKTKWQQLNGDTFNEMFSHSAMKRAGFEGLKRNIEFISQEP